MLVLVTWDRKEGITGYSAVSSLKCASLAGGLELSSLAIPTPVPSLICLDSWSVPAWL